MKKIVTILVLSIVICALFFFGKQPKALPSVVQKTVPRDTTVYPTSHLEEPNIAGAVTNNITVDPSGPLVPVQEERIKIRDTRLPNLGEFTLYYADSLKDTLVCVTDENDRAPGIYLCTDPEYAEMTTAYDQFKKYFLQKDMENAWKMGKKLWPYFSGFGGDKYRVYRGSLITITFGPQAWGDVSFGTYTLLDGKIIEQHFSMHESDFTSWQDAIVAKFQMKSFDDLYNGSIKPDGEKWKSIMKYADEYWYDRFMKTSIQ